MAIPLSILDLTVIPQGKSAAEALSTSVELARLAERVGYKRIWYAEHHNNARIASSVPAVMIAHVAAHTEKIRLGSGGVMLPNHSPLVVAEQYGLLETLHPGRIDLALGRAPGTDHATTRALRRFPDSAERFPDDVLELQGYLSGKSRINAVEATPGRATNVPLYILGSSLFGAQLAAHFGLPYAFASQFAPDSLIEAVATYRREFQPSEHLAEPYVIAGVNVIAADTRADAQQQLLAAQRGLVSALQRNGRPIPDEEADAILASPGGFQIRHLLTYTALGTPTEVKEYLETFARHGQIDELMTVHQSPDACTRLRSVELLAQAML
ncbi:MAG: LLM class flavin-dependent oxidoreductase [Armatimonas sp.]